MILDAYFEPQFSDRSHGFRRGRGCHTALREIYRYWRGTVWFIEGDIRGCFDHIDHAVLLSILREKIVDSRFLRLIEGYWGAGYLADWKYHRTSSGTPQGGILSPILSNIYLDRLDRYVESTLIPRFNRGTARKPNQDYSKLLKRAWYLKSMGRRDEARVVRKEMHRLPVYVLHDSEYRRLKYVRYADNILIGFVGSLEEAEIVHRELVAFLRDQLRLDVPVDKTRIVHARSSSARFLGYEVTVSHDNDTRRRGRRTINGLVSLRVPRHVITEKGKRYRKRGRPMHRYEFVNQSVVDIVNHYESEFRGVANFYRMAHNLGQLSRLRGVMQRSLTMTLAHKFQITVAQVYRRCRAYIRDEYGNRKSVLEVRVEREGKPPLIARWGAVSLRWRIETTIDDRLAPYRAINATELVQRLLAEKCELCGSEESIEVHHVRALRDLNRKGRSERPLWARLMAARRRKTLVLCRRCHVDLHMGRCAVDGQRGRLQRAFGAHDTGEPDDAKVSSPVRRGPTEKACASGTSPAAYPTRANRTKRTAPNMYPPPL